MGTVNNYGNVLLAAGSNTIDVQSLLTAAIQADEEPLTNLQSQQTTLETQIAALESIQNDFQSLSTAVSDLTSTGGSVNSFTATSSNSSIVTASADSTATAGTHSIVVNSLATTSSYYTDPVASGNSITQGSFDIAVGNNAPVTVNVTGSNNDLNDLAASINGLNAGVTATVVTDANGSRLALVSNTSGSAGDITISNNTTSLNFNQATQGQDASLTVDGVPIDSSSNSVSTVIPGVTLNLAGAASGTTATVTVAPNANSAETAINNFVSAWNTVINDLNTQFDVTSSNSGGPLEADNTLRGIQDQLLSAITTSVSGNGGVVNLASIGVNMNDDGTLSVDSGTLSNALSTNFTAVQSMLQGTSGVATFLSNTMSQITDPSQGSLTLDLQGLNQSNTDLTNQISSMQTQLTAQEQALTTQYAQMEVTLQEMPSLQSQVQQELTSLG